MAMLQNKTMQNFTRKPVIRKADMAGHDILHLFPEGSPFRHPAGLRYCHCMCQRCWRGWRIGDKLVGKCVCADCPCRGRLG